MISLAVKYCPTVLSISNFKNKFWQIAPKTSSILYARWLYEATVSRSCLQVREYAIRSAWDKQERIASSVVGGLHVCRCIINVH